MKGQLNSLFEVNAQPELIQVDCYGWLFGILRHFSIPSNLIEKIGDFAWNKNNEKNLTVITVRNHTICLKWRQSQNASLEWQTVTSSLKEVVSYEPIELGRRRTIVQKTEQHMLKRS